jgi:hypothetical protein
MIYATYIIAAALIGAFLFRRRLFRSAPLGDAHPLTKVRISAEAGLFAVE